MKDLKNNIIGITLGIRFNRSFRIPDISGDMVDNIAVKGMSLEYCHYIKRFRIYQKENKILKQPIGVFDFGHSHLTLLPKIKNKKLIYHLE